MKLKKIKLIYNPKAGTGAFPRYLDTFINKFQRNGYIIEVFRSLNRGDLYQGLQGLKPREYSMIVIAGGDGSVNEIVNDMIEAEIDLPLGIIPAGTSNDFASYLQIPGNIEKAAETILKERQLTIDIGRVNQRYFVNVCVGGMLSEIAHSTDTVFKNKLGKLAYYINGLKEVSRLQTMDLKITTSQRVIEDTFFIFMVLNSSKAGGFKNLAPEASLTDGLFDLMAVKASNLMKLPGSVARFFQGENLNNDSILYLQDNYFQIEELSRTSAQHCDIDGEKGPEFPLEIEVLPQKITVFNDL